MLAQFDRAIPRIVAVVVVVVMGSVLAGCGRDSATPLSLVRAASDATTSKHTALIAMTVNGGSAALSNLSFDGAFDFDAKLARVSIDASNLGLPGASGKIETIMEFGDNVVMYMRMPAMGDATGGKEWMKIDLLATLKTACPDTDLSALFRGQSGDPTSGLQLLESAKEVTTVGEEEVRGDETTHYRVVIDLTKAYATTPELAQLTTATTQSVDVWLDDDGRVRRFETSQDASTLRMPPCLAAAAQTGASPVTGTTKVTYEMYDFGKDVNITVPAPSEVADFQQLMPGVPAGVPAA